MANTAQSEVVIDMRNSAPEQQVLATEMTERPDVSYYKQFELARDQKLVPYAIGIFNCLLGCIQIVLSIVLTDFSVKDARYYTQQTAVIFGLRNLAAGLGNFQSVIWSGILLLLTGIAGILTKTKSSTSMLLFSSITALLASLSCVGTIGYNFGTIRFIVTGEYRDADRFAIVAVTLSLAAAGIGGSITQSVFSIRNLLEYFDWRMNSVQKETRQTRQHPISTTEIIYIGISGRLRTALISVSITEMICGITIVIIQSIASSWTKLSEINYYGNRDATLHGLQLHFFPGILAGVILCVFGYFGCMTSRRTSRGVLNATLALSMLAAGCSLTANFVAINLIHPPPYIAGFPWPEPTVAFSAIAIVVCIAHSSLICKIQCQEQDEIETVMVPSAHINDVYSNGSLIEVPSTSYPTHNFGPETIVFPQ